jgi:hypothetical protein
MKVTAVPDYSGKDFVYNKNKYKIVVPVAANVSKGLL